MDTPAPVRPQSIMHLRRHLSLCFLLTTSALLAQPKAGIEFNGVIVTNTKVTVALKNPATGLESWIAVGDKFGDRTLTAYFPADEKAGRPTDTVVLTRDGTGQRETIALNSALIVPAERDGATAGSGPIPSPDAKNPGLKPNADTITTVLPPGAQLRAPLDTRKPTVVGQSVISQKPTADGRIVVSKVTLRGYIAYGDPAQLVYDPMFSTASIEVRPENAADAQNNFIADPVSSKAPPRPARSAAGQGTITAGRTR